MVVAGEPEAVATRVRMPRTVESGTGTSTQPLTTTPVSGTQRSSTTNKPSPLLGSRNAPPRGTRWSGSHLSGSSPTTGPATNQGSGTGPVPKLGPSSKRPGHDDPKPTGKSNDSTASSSRNGSTSPPGHQTPNATRPTTDSSTSTITTEPTERSNGQPHQHPQGQPPRRAHLTAGVLGIIFASIHVWMM